MGRAADVVEEDRTADADLVTQTFGVRALHLEGGVVADVFPRMGLARVHEGEGHVGMAVGDSVEQRTLC